MAAEQAELTKQQILDREARWARPVALAALVTPLFLIAAIIVGSSEVNPTSVDAAGLEAFEGAPGQQLIATVLQVAQVALFAPVLLYMFLAASARSDRMRPAFVGVTVAGPLFLAASLIPGWIALDSAASAFVSGGGDLALSPNERADELMNDQGANGIFGGLQLAGSLGLIVGMVYTSLYASRVGLLTRSSGIVGIVLGIGLLFVGLFGIQLFIIALGLLVAGFWPRGRPPACGPQHFRPSQPGPRVSRRRRR